MDISVPPNLINRQWAGFSADDTREIRTVLNQFLLDQHENIPSFICNKLVKLVVDIGRSDWPHFYPDFFPSILQCSNENLSPQIIRQIAKEIADLTKDPPEGIKIFPNEEDITDIRASIEGPAGTPYAGGVFKMKLLLGKNFPSEPPKGFFVTKIFHPNVASNGEICVNTLKKDWTSELGIKHVLLTVKCLLIVPNPESALNEEAGKLLLEQYDDYSTRAKIFTEIHAKPPRMPLTEEVLQQKCTDGPLAKKHAGDKILLDKKKKDKKKVLKRL